MMALATNRLASVSALAVLAVLAASPAAAQSSTLDSLMSVFGLKSSDDREEIEYRERAPLVVPPRMQLRPPEEPVAKRTAAWPNDPDVARRKQQNAEARVPRTEQESYKLDKDSRLSLSQMQSKRNPGGSGSAGQRPVHGDNSRDGHWVGPAEFSRINNEWRKDPEQVLAAGVEPSRRYLTDPPPGYRKPSANAPLVTPRGAVTIKQTENEEASAYQITRPQSED